MKESSSSGPLSLLPGLTRAAARLRCGLAAGRFVGAQVFVWQRGEVIADAGAGLARPGIPMTAQTLTHWFCCTKPLTAIAVAQLAEGGALHISDRVCALIPEFAAGGKESITIRHLLTHTAGLRQLRSPRPFLASDDDIVAAVCSSAILDGWAPGERAAYSPFAGWYILGAIVERVSGERLPDYVARHIFAPLGLDRCWLGMPANALARERAGLSIPHAVADGRAPVPIRYLGSPAALQWINAASGAVGPISSLGTIFLSLLCPGETAALLSPETVQMIVAPHRTGLLDETYQLTWDWGLGFAADLSELCCAAHAQGFGHPGGSTVVVADRRAERIVAVAVNGLTAWDGAPEIGGDCAASQLVRDICRDLEAR